MTVDLQTPLLTARGPLDGRAEAFAAVTGDVAIRALPLARSYNIRIDPARAEALVAVLGAPLPGVSRWNATEDGGTIVWLGPDEFLLSDPAGSADLETELRAAVLPSGGAVVEQSGQRVSVLVSGDARGLLAKGTAVDLHPSAFPLGTAVQSFLGQSTVVLLARSRDASEIELLVRSSFARSVGDWLLDAVGDPLAYPAG
ncbi:sarcosine oxidase subunit gamma [Rathayibacter sp. VKM Ac-2759]|uniref:sarcosine oxidase subunit gamma n=1 Tax=Rathayibacter sp. VKM Ac-2759 TaxID=2609252 RepID=UPI0013172D93|nr:sarcosine oxidase subunit gamma family protein [Rathayibacter sp. VKM Ac-2759]QHC68051.1 sarcosine oxidase subunit gamma [Rathayibacter sp. VKM Ac-2759]